MASDSPPPLAIGPLTATAGSRVIDLIAVDLGSVTVEIPIVLVNGARPGPRVAATAGAPDRLERCREDLGRPDLAALPVASLVSRWGVVSVQHFTNVFRATYGQTPAGYRRQVLGADAEAPS